MTVHIIVDVKGRPVMATAYADRSLAEDVARRSADAVRRRSPEFRGALFTIRTFELVGKRT